LAGLDAQVDVLQDGDGLVAGAELAVQVAQFEKWRAGGGLTHDGAPACRLQAESGGSRTLSGPLAGGGRGQAAADNDFLAHLQAADHLDVDVVIDADADLTAFDGARRGQHANGGRASWLASLLASGAVGGGSRGAAARRARGVARTARPCRRRGAALSRPHTWSRGAGSPRT